MVALYLPLAQLRGSKARTSHRGGGNTYVSLENGGTPKKGTPDRGAFQHRTTQLYGWREDRVALMKW